MMDEEAQTANENAGNANNPKDTPSVPDVVGSSKRRRKLRSKKRVPKIAVRVGLGLIITGLVGLGGWYILKEPSFEEETTQEDSTLQSPELPEEEPTSTPAPTEVEIDRTDITVEIFNGTGIPKEASFLRDKISDLGYERIDVGNASDQEYETTVVTYADSLDEAVKDEITKVLRSTYVEVNVKTSSTQKIDVQVITGLREGQALPTPEPTSEPTLTPTVGPSPTASPSATPTP